MPSEFRHMTPEQFKLLAQDAYAAALALDTPEPADDGPVILPFRSGNERDLGEERICDLGCKLAALLLLNDRIQRLVVPSAEEWIGIGLLERDDELPERI